MPIDFKALESAEILSAVESIKTQQEVFKNENGRFWQGAKTLSRAPRGDRPEVLNRNAKVTSEVKDWSAFGANLPMSSPVGFEVHEYNGPQGRGFSILLTTNDGRDNFVKVIHSGPETEREHDWSLVPTK